MFREARSLRVVSTPESSGRKESMVSPGTMCDDA